MVTISHHQRRQRSLCPWASNVWFANPCTKVKLNKYQIELLYTLRNLCSTSRMTDWKIHLLPLHSKFHGLDQPFFPQIQVVWPNATKPGQQLAKTTDWYVVVRFAYVRANRDWLAQDSDIGSQSITTRKTFSTKVNIYNVQDCKVPSSNGFACHRRIVSLGWESRCAGDLLSLFSIGAI